MCNDHYLIFSQISKALKEVDSVIKYLLDKLTELSLFESVNLIIVSDHGMSRVTGVVNAEDIFPLNMTHSIEYGTVAFIRPLSPGCKSKISPLLNYHDISSRQGNNIQKT